MMNKLLERYIEMTKKMAKELQEKDDRIYELEMELEEAYDKWNLTENTLTLRDRELIEAKTTIVQLENEITSKEYEIDELEIEVEKNRKSIKDNLKIHLEDLDNAKRAKEERAMEYMELLDEYGEAKEIIEDLMEDISVKEERIADLEEELDETKEICIYFEEKMLDVEEELDGANIYIEELEDELDDVILERAMRYNQVKELLETWQNRE